LCQRALGESGTGGQNLAKGSKIVLIIRLKTLKPASAGVSLLGSICVLGASLGDGASSGGN
jgi:hypothetical protein